MSAEGPVPEQPSGSELGPIDERPTKDDPLTGIAETIVTNVFQTTFGQLTAAQQAQFDVPLANSASVTCKDASHRAEHASLWLLAKVTFCYNTILEEITPPALIYSVDAGATGATFVVSKTHKRTSGGFGYDHVYTKAKAKYCTADHPNMCTGFDVMRIKTYQEAEDGSSSATWAYWYE